MARRMVLDRRRSPLRYRVAAVGPSKVGCHRDRRRRDNVLAQAVSWLRAEQTGGWTDTDPGAVDASGSPTGEPRYDPDGIDALLRTIAEHQAAWEAWFARHGVTPHRVRYEDLAADPSGVTRDVLDALGLPSAGVPVRPRHGRQADALNAEWIARHRSRT